MGGTDPGPSHGGKTGRKSVPAITKKQQHRENVAMKKLESQQQASSSHAQNHDLYVDAYPKRTPDTPCFLSFQGKSCTCGRGICDEQRAKPMETVEPVEKQPLLNSINDFDLLYSLSLTVTDKKTKFAVNPALMDRLVERARGPSNNERYKAIHCLTFLSAMRIVKLECCKVPHCYGKCFAKPRLDQIDEDIVFEELYVGRGFTQLTPAEVRVVSNIAHKCKIYVKEFFNHIPDGPLVRFERFELELHTQLTVLKNAIETLRTYGPGTTCCNKECWPKLCCQVNERLLDLEWKADPMFMYVHGNDFKTISTGPRRREIWLEFGRLKSLRNAKFSVMNSDNFLQLDIDEEMVHSDFITKVSKAFGVSCCRNKCAGGCSLVEDTRRRLFKDESTLLTDDVLSDRMVEFDVPVHSSPAFWLAIILFPFVLLASWWHSLIMYDLVIYVAVSCSALSLSLPFWYTVRHHSNLTEEETLEVQNSMTDGKRPYCNPLGTRKEKEEFIAPSLTRVSITSRSYFSYVLCFDDHKICEVPHLVNFLETHPFLLFSLLSTLLLPWWDRGLQFATWYILFAMMACAYRVDNTRIKLICRQAFAAIVSKDSIMHGKSLLDFQVSVSTLVRQLDNLLHPMVTLFFTKNHENIMNLTIDVATLAYHARKQSESWLSYLKVEAPRNSGMISLVWSDMVMGFFQPLLLCLARGLVFLLVVVAPVISLHALTQIVLRATITSVFFPLVVFFSLVPLIHTLILEALTQPYLGQYIAFVEELQNRIAQRCVESEDSLLAGLARTCTRLIVRCLNFISGWNVPITQWLRRPSWLTCCSDSRQEDSGRQASTSSSVWSRLVRFTEQNNYVTPRASSNTSMEMIPMLILTDSGDEDANLSQEDSSEGENLTASSPSLFSSPCSSQDPLYSRDLIDQSDLIDPDLETSRLTPLLRPSNILGSSYLEL